MMHGAFGAAEEFNLAFNRAGPAGMASITSALRQAKGGGKQLKTLLVCHNSCGLAAALHLLQTLATTDTCPELSYLGLSNNVAPQVGPGAPVGGLADSLDLSPAFAERVAMKLDNDKPDERALAAAARLAGD
jgi:hypothetical protein